MTPIDPTNYQIFPCYARLLSPTERKKLVTDETVKLIY